MSMDHIIRETLTRFIHSHIPDADLSTLDEVFFSYITGILEELGSQDASEEDFEMDTFVEMLEGYIPGFAEISSEKVYEIMFELSGQINEARNKKNISQTCAVDSSVLVVETCSKKPSEKDLPTSSEGAEAQEDELKNGIDLLLEMFPLCTVSQAKKVLAMAKGDLEDAVQIIVDRKVKIGTDSSAKELQSAPKKEDLKDFILQKYMMVDNEEDKKTHRPLAPKEAPKKMIRYIDNQVVSTKGERYKDVKKPESEEMKKTYINLKPARKYKFH
ncbi:CUE domain-containing protein 2 isoform 1-T3 [Discoglossus pictus]